MTLTATAVAQAKPASKTIKLFDGEGLFLLIKPSGSKWWRFKYRYHGKEKLISLGTYPEISLKEARERKAEARKALSQSIDPGLKRQLFKSAAVESSSNTFETVALDWIAKNSPNWSESHKKKILGRLKRDVFPWLGSRPIAEIQAPELRQCLARIEKRGVIETAHRVLENAGSVFRFAVATGKVEQDVSTALRGFLPPSRRKHHPSITDPQGIKKLMAAISGYNGSFIVKCALQLAPLVFVRPGELRGAKWKEIDLENAEWRIPIERMKMKELHIVPLSKQAIAILKDLSPATEKSKEHYLFPGARMNGRSMSDNAINSALRAMGYGKEEMTGHGFRSMASTILNEKGFNRDAIERQLAHGERNKIRAAYNYAQLLPERREMMQWWADYLNGLEKSDSSVSP